MDLARHTRRPPTTLKVGLADQSSNNIIKYLAYLLPDRSRISKRKASGNRSGEFKSSIKYHVSHVSSTLHYSLLNKDRQALLCHQLQIFLTSSLV